LIFQFEVCYLCEAHVKRGTTFINRAEKRNNKPFTNIKSSFMEKKNLPTSATLAGLFRKAILPAALFAGALQAGAQTAADSTTITGTVYNDKNGLKNGLIDGPVIKEVRRFPYSQSNPTLYAIQQQLYVYLLTPSHTVFDAAPVNDFGQFSLKGLKNSTYSVALSTDVAPIDGPEPTLVLNNFWEATAEGSTGTTGDLNPNLTIPISTGALSSMAFVFGIDARPQGLDYHVTQNMRDPLDNNKAMIPATAFRGSDVEDGTYTSGMTGRDIDLFAASNGTLYYDGVVVASSSPSVAARIPSFDPAKLRFLFRPGTPRQFTYALVDDAGISQSVPSIVYLDIALPVTLTSFSGRRDNEQNLLEWTTATEKVNNGFYVERSNDGENFEEAGFVPSKALYGMSNTPTNYSFRDNLGNSASANYYRLRQTDADGTTQFSKTIKLGNGSRMDAGQMSAYPSPSNGPLTLDWNAGADVYLVHVQNATGATVLSQQVQGAGGKLHSTLDLSTLPSGNYIVSLKGGDQQQSQLITIKAK
jgi:hypothetical protein